MEDLFVVSSHLRIRRRKQICLSKFIKGCASLTFLGQGKSQGMVRLGLIGIDAHFLPVFGDCAIHILLVTQIMHGLKVELASESVS